MNKRLMLDTCICIDLLRKKSDREKEKIKLFDPGQVVISAITHSELVYGAMLSLRSDYHLQLIQDFIESIPVCDYTSQASFIYAQNRCALKKRGLQIGSHDLLIASHAIAEDCLLGTHNLREFKRISGLQLFDLK